MATGIREQQLLHIMSALNGKNPKPTASSLMMMLNSKQFRKALSSNNTDAVVKQITKVLSKHAGNTARGSESAIQVLNKLLDVAETRKTSPKVMQGLQSALSQLESGALAGKNMGIPAKVGATMSSTVGKHATKIQGSRGYPNAISNVLSTMQKRVPQAGGMDAAILGSLPVDMAGAGATIGKATKVAGSGGGGMGPLPVLPEAAAGQTAGKLAGLKGLLGKGGGLMPFLYMLMAAGAGSSLEKIFHGDPMQHNLQMQELESMGNSMSSEAMYANQMNPVYDQRMMQSQAMFAQQLAKGEELIGG